MIITPNKRLARALLAEYDNKHAEIGLLAVEAPLILPWQGFVDYLWQQLASKGIVLPNRLTVLQAHFFCKQIAGISFAQVDGLLDACAKAHMYPIGVDESSWFFAKKIKIERALQQQHYCLPHQQVSIIIAHLQHLNLSTEVKFTGFLEITPHQQLLLDACGAQKLDEPGRQSEHSFQRAPFPNPLAQWRAALDFAQHAIQNGAKRVGIVIPNLSKDYARVRHMAHAHLPKEIVYNISSGVPLNQMPMVQVLCLIMKWLHTPLSFAEFSEILRTLWLSDGISSRPAHLLFEKRLRDMNVWQVPIDFSLSKNTFSAWQKLLPLAEDVRNNPNRPLLEWHTLLLAMIDRLGWPGTVSLTSEDYQCVEMFFETLHEWLTLAHLQEQWGYQESCDALHECLANRLFQPKSNPLAQLEILGTLEALALPFDALWVCDVSDTQWPAPLSPNPYLPILEQRRLKMPRACPIHEMEYAKATLATFRQQAPMGMMSIANTDPDITVDYSALIMDLPHYCRPDQACSANPSVGAQADPAVLEYYIDDTCPPWQEEQRVPGGSKLFRLFAACPYQAQAKIRLRMEPLQSPTIGLNAKIRGIVLHEVMHLFWQDIKNSNTLHTKTITELQQILTPIIVNVLHKQAGHIWRLLPKESHQLEIERWLACLIPYLEFEKTRAAFVVEALEEASEVEFAGLKFKTRIDRVDTALTGEKILIDYKTGNVDRSQWLLDTNQDLQLPFYALTSATPPSAMVLARIRPEEKKHWIGLAKENGDWPADVVLPQNLRAPISWDELMGQWQATLTNVALDFQKGCAAPEPTGGRQTCADCGLKSICRQAD